MPVTEEVAQTGTDPLKVKPGRCLVADIGRGPERLLVMASAPGVGCRYLQDSVGQQWEVQFRGGHATVVADPQRLDVRARLVANAYKQGLQVRHTTTYRRAYNTTTSLHLNGCPHLVAPSGEDERVTTSEYGPSEWGFRAAGRQADLRARAIEEHRTRTATCDCIENGEVPAAAEPAA